MKWLVFLSWILTMATATGQTTNALPPAPPVPLSQAPQLEVTGKKHELALPTLSLRQAAPNEVIRGNLSYSGVVVEAVKTRRPLQLINPLAPPQYGTPEENVFRDPVDKRVLGLKLFAIRF